MQVSDSTQVKAEEHTDDVTPMTSHSDDVTQHREAPEVVESPLLKWTTNAQLGERYLPSPSFLPPARWATLLCFQNTSLLSLLLHFQMAQWKWKKWEEASYSPTDE